ncbi:type IV toxin-antitoxin system AbiEi family antitoxin domain-containing protein [Nesterenkonia xinjiangensis]|uniref:Putative transcriptional regulator of viral defense system n=1 Tax=Nesterenkonia xinjiangensis TaxID=225327 RepID=A0A7Z0GJ98_9MICC|nr:type IV toxin-antitoxin system AbiEi family antitoxin domain-containing protein [Nesterenkonia xinjiangensis]NYJ77021.1 putative transcriptional regulator of viral defense system [Nesterenkonia xinjiangensis]
MAVIDLAPVFTLEQARATGLRKDQVYDLIAAGEIERIGRGVYLRPDSIDPFFASLAAVATVRPEAAMCLTSALTHHDLTDSIPFGSDIAIPRGTRQPAGFDHVIWHSFDAKTFSLGRETTEITGGVTVGIYSAERTIVDCFRLRHREGSDVAYEALRRWLRRSSSSPAALLSVSAHFPKAHAQLRLALEVLL